MTKKYPWYFVFLIFVLMCLANIFQKLQWDSPSDYIQWVEGEDGLVCIKAPKDCGVKKDDILLSVSKYVVKNNVDLNRVIALEISKKNYFRYNVERDGVLKDVGINIYKRYTPFSYYILVFAGIVMIMLTLRILNISIKKQKGFSPPPIFYLLTLSYSGFLIFSPTGNYSTGDFIYLVLDRVGFLFFPALLLHYSLYFPIKSRLLRKFKPKFLRLCIYLPPSTLLVLNILFLVFFMGSLDTEHIAGAVSYLRGVFIHYFSFYIFLSLIFFLISNLTLILWKKQKRFILPLSGIALSIFSLLAFNYLLGRGAIANLVLFSLALLPLSVTSFLGHRKFRDIEIVIKKTVAVSYIFPFIFGIYFLLDNTIEQSNLMGIFLAIIAIITAGLLYKPIEDIAHSYFEQFFFRGTYNFRKKLKGLTESLPTERDLSSLSTSFLNTVNNGFKLQKSMLFIHHKKNVFYSLPQKKKIVLSGSFRNNLLNRNNLVFFSAGEFERKFPKDYILMKEMNYFQFLPLKTPDKLIGLVAFGPKLDNTYLSVEDWELLFNISSPLSLSVENASLYSELKTQFDEINLLKEFNENIIENMNLGIVVLSGLNIIKTWNNIMELKFGLSAAKAINRKAHAVFGSTLWKRIYKKKKTNSSIDNFTMEIAGNELIFDIYISPLKDSVGKRIGTILLFEDVTEKVSIRRQLVTAEKMASLGLLSAGIAHEVNTPLTGISSYCQLILSSPEDPENIELIAKVQEQVQRANKIIRTLLDFSRQKGELPMQLSLDKIINESIALVEHKLKQRNIVLVKDFKFSRKLYGFSTRLQQLFINLLINASDATPAPGGKISIYGSETDTELSVRIKDNGKGIESKYLDKIFDPFFTTKEQGKGTGLGLSIVYTIVEEHFGEITADSKADKGTTFYITLPIESPLRSIKI